MKTYGCLAFEVVGCFFLVLKKFIYEFIYECVKHIEDEQLFFRDIFHVSTKWPNDTRIRSCGSCISSF